LKTPAAPIVGMLREKIAIDVEQILASLYRLQEKVEQVIVEGAGGWLVPIGSNYFVSDLAVEMNLPVVVVAQNRLGCLNHTALTVRSIAASGLACAGVVLNSPEIPTDVAALTNADILRRIIDVPLLRALGDNLTEVPEDWRLMLYSIK
jgi:dethiobiotin synthetase